MQPYYGTVKLRSLLAIATKPGIIKIILYGEPLLVLIYVNDLDNNTSTAISTKPTLCV